MQLDDELCLCFHVTKRKVINFVRVERPQVASQMSECHGAGTGCGWCRPFLMKLFEAAQANAAGTTDDLPSAEATLDTTPALLKLRSVMAPIMPRALKL